MGAGLQQNLGKDWGLEVWRQMVEASPNKVFKDVADRSAKKVRKRRPPRKLKRVEDEASICGLMTQLQLAVPIADMMMVLHQKKLLMIFHKTRLLLSGSMSTVLY